MTTRTRKASTTPAPAGTPAKRAAAKKTPAARTPRKKTTAKKAQPRLSLVKPDTSTKVDTRTPLPVRRRIFVGSMGAHEQAADRAALASASLALPIPVRTWNGSQAQLADGTLLIHNPGHDRTFTAHIACPHGAIHNWPITSADDLKTARAVTRICQRRHANTTPGENGTSLNWDKALAHGVQRTSRLGEGLTVARKAVADTQSLDLNQIDAGLTARADHDQMKEHPQP